MKIRINKIKIPKERLRYTSGKSIKDLKKSMEEIGLIQPVVVNEAYKLIAGHRRLRAAKKLGWKEIDANVVRNLTPFKEFLVELHENWKRKNFTDAELRKALYKGKQIYEKNHPETTVEEKYIKQERDPKGRFGDKKSVKPEVGISVGKEKSRNESKPAERFTKNIAKNLNISETQIKDHIEAEKAIEKGEVPKEMEKEKTYKIVKHLRDLKKKKKEKEINNTYENLDTPSHWGGGVVAQAIKNSMLETYESKSVEKELCNECKKAKVITCPFCDKVFYKCEEEGEHKFSKKKCRYFEQ